ncbi:MAG: 16S rRNA (cytosine(1402)-N(4))-methyltransferase, partial [Sulfuricurvum sp. RIFCSPLOWO2_02_43_6]
MQETPHIPVLYREVIEAFSVCKEGSVIDCTMGYGGHSSLLLDNNGALTLIGIDQDPTAIAFSSKRLEPYGN